MQLIKNNEYEYADIILSSFLNLGDSELKKIQRLEKLLPQIDLGHSYLKNYELLMLIYNITNYMRIRGLHQAFICVQWQLLWVIKIFI